jgi:hypothetical protein
MIGAFVQLGRNALVACHALRTGEPQMSKPGDCHEIEIVAAVRLGARCRPRAPEYRPMRRPGCGQTERRSRWQVPIAETPWVEMGIDIEARVTCLRPSWQRRPSMLGAGIPRNTAGQRCASIIVEPL